jgi:anti-sigma factor RsiW
MSCPKTKLISAYLDKEMGRGEKSAFETHLQVCSNCSHTLEELRSLRLAFSKAERHQAPYGFATRVVARTAKLDKKESPWFVPFSIRFAEVALLFVVITVGILAGRVMTNRSSAVQTTNIASSLSLDLFDATPPGSLGGTYLAMTEVSNEK